MKIYLGKTGLNKSWQEPFEETISCPKCGKTARIMFVGFEGDEKKYICQLYDNTGGDKNGKYWFHDACAVAVYLCEKCFEPCAVVNQA